MIVVTQTRGAVALLTDTSQVTLQNDSDEPAFVITPGAGFFDLERVARFLLPGEWLEVAGGRVFEPRAERAVTDSGREFTTAANPEYQPSNADAMERRLRSVIDTVSARVDAAERRAARAEADLVERAADAEHVEGQDDADPVVEE